MNDKVLDYSGFQDQTSGAVTEDKFTQLMNLAQQARELEVELEDDDAALGKKRDTYRTLVEFQIPSIMEELGVKDFTTLTGIPVKLASRVRASIPKPRNNEAMNWLEDRGLGGLIKRRFIIAFNKEEEAWASKFEADLKKRKREVDCKQELKVEPATLTALISRRLEEGKEVDMGLFGVFVQKFAKLGATKE